MARVTVFCSSSDQVSPIYFSEMENLAKGLAKNNIEIVYGGACVGLMGTLADEALRNGGFVKGVIPEYLNKEGIVHEGLGELSIVKNLLDRKKLMLEGTDAVIAFPGGMGTLDEVTEVLALKQLGEYKRPIYFLNFLDSWQTLLNYFEELQQLKMIYRETLDELYEVFEDSQSLIKHIVKVVN